VLAVELVAAEAPHLQGPDIDTFLRWGCRYSYGL
jgi:hypothetical protein